MAETKNNRNIPTSRLSEEAKRCSVQHPTKGNYLSSENDAVYYITDEEIVFAKAMERYKREYNRPYPTYQEVLYVAKGLGWTRFPKPSGETE